MNSRALTSIMMMNQFSEIMKAQRSDQGQRTGNRPPAGDISFDSQLLAAKKAGNADLSEEDRVTAYTEHLKDKYGIVRIESVGRDQKSLDKIAGTMRGGDVIIAPNMLEKMAKDEKIAAKIEEIIDDVHENIPKWTAEYAAKDMTFESLGVIVHEDGTVTHICGGGDSPERVAEVNRINKEKREKEAAEHKAILERSQEAARQRRMIAEAAIQQRLQAESIRQVFFTPADTHIAQQPDVAFISIVGI